MSLVPLGNQNPPDGASMMNEARQDPVGVYQDLDTQALGENIRGILAPFGEDSDLESDQLPSQD